MMTPYETPHEAMEHFVLSRTAAARVSSIEIKERKDALGMHTLNPKP